MVDSVPLELLIHKQQTPLYALSSLGTHSTFCLKLKSSSPQGYQLPNGA